MWSRNFLHIGYSYGFNEEGEADRISKQEYTDLSERFLKVQNRTIDIMAAKDSKLQSFRSEQYMFLLA
jgi:hypothetical protein